MKKELNIKLKEGKAQADGREVSKLDWSQTNIKRYSKSTR